MTFQELEDLAVSEFRKHYQALGAADPESGISVDRRKDGDRMEIFISAPLSPILAMTNDLIHPIAMCLGIREMFSRMLEFYDYENIPVIERMLEGETMRFQEVWHECELWSEKRFGPEKWNEMIAAIMAQKSNNVYSTWTSVILDPDKPQDSQVHIASAFSVDSDYLLPDEKRGRNLHGFSSWVREKAQGA